MDLNKSKKYIDKLEILPNRNYLVSDTKINIITRCTLDSFWFIVSKGLQYFTF
jgi:hypothetical protein